MKHILFAGLAIACAAAAVAAPVEGRHANGIRSLDGGVGDADQQAMKAAAPDYSLGLTFASDSGAYLADVEVDVRDAKGRSIFTTRARGPILLVDLPAGRYSVAASFQGRTRQADVTLAQGKSRALTMRWPDR